MVVEQTQDSATKGSKKLLIIIAAVAFVLLGAGAAIFFMSSDSAGSNESINLNQRVIAESPVSYVNIAQPFVFNVTGDSRNRVVQIKVQLMIRGSENDGLARYHSPLIESTLLATFASATVDQLREPTGRTELRDKATNDIKAAMTKVVGQPVIERVLFTDFVMQ